MTRRELIEQLRAYGDLDDPVVASTSSADVGWEVLHVEERMSGERHVAAITLGRVPITLEREA